MARKKTEVTPAVDTTHNGWTNYETWSVNLWMSNDEGSDEHYRELAQEAWDEAEADKTFSREERATYALAQSLKDEFGEACPLDDANVWTDLLRAALSEVNWDEIASHLIEDTDKEAD